MSLTCFQLRKNHRRAWQKATVHPFLEQCQSGKIQPQQFNTWLVQDYLFVVEFTRLLGTILSNAPLAHIDVILAGLSALKDELNWFREQAASRQLNLETSKQKATQEYCEYMAQIASMSYPVQAIALWAIELAYNQAWQFPETMSETYREFAARWGNPEFTKYVKLLEKQADEALKSASLTCQQQAESSFLKIANLEHNFWQMAFDGQEE